MLFPATLGIPPVQPHLGPFLNTLPHWQGDPGSPRWCPRSDLSGPASAACPAPSPVQVVEHPLWHLHALRNDIALLKLATPARLSGAVSPVCLPSTNTSFPTGSLCATTGWGKTRHNGECPCGVF